MTEERLDQLFSAARSEAPQTAASEVAGWLAAGTAAAATIGFAAKLKLVLTKKMIIMMTGTFGVLTTAVIVTTAVMDPGKPDMNEPAGVVAENETHEIVNEEIKPNGIADINDTPFVYVYTPVPAEAVTPYVSITTAPSGTTVYTYTPTSSSGTTVYTYTPTPPLAIFTPAPPSAPVYAFTYTAGDDTSKTTAVQKELDILPFSRLELNGVYDVVIAQGDEYKLVVESDDENQVMANQDGDLLTISNEGMYASCGGDEENDKRRKDKKDKEDRVAEDKDGITLYITVKDLSELSMNGIGNVTVTSLSMDDLHVFFNGVGDMNLTLDCKHVELQSSGIGNVTVAGKSEKVMINYSGVGDIEAYEFVVQDLSVMCSGIGNLFVYAETSINLESSGVGDILYKGNPENKTLNFSGIGSIRSK